MPEFLVESYDPGGPRPLPATVPRAVRHVRSTFVPEDEVCLHFFEAPSRDAVAEALGAAAVAYDRIVETRA